MPKASLLSLAPALLIAFTATPKDHSDCLEEERSLCVVRKVYVGEDCSSPEGQPICDAECRKVAFEICGQEPLHR